jgi:hypothetical protein
MRWHLGRFFRQPCQRREEAYGIPASKAKQSKAKQSKGKLTKDYQQGLPATVQ